MKKILFLFALCAMLFAVRSVFAQTSPTQATNSGQTVSPTQSAVHLTFPISELGNCSSASECKTYCDDPTHVDACVAYAKAKGFYKETVLDTEKQAVLADAKVTLGCGDEASCRVFCADDANADTCSAFAKKHNLKGGNGELHNDTLAKAKAAFGCDSIDSCRTFCEKAENRDTCAAFAKSNGLKGGNEKVGPGGCTSESSCTVFCSDPNNFSLCSRFTTSHTGSSSSQKAFTGPGGCRSESSCREYCEKNPTACHLPPLSGTPRPTEIHPSGITIKPTLTPEQYCHMYPDHCANLTPTRTDSANGPTPTKSPTPDYTAYCQSKGSGCTLTGSSCICPPTPTHGANSSTEPTKTPTPTSATSHDATPTPTGTVQGLSTQRNIFQWFVDTFFHVR